MNIDIAVFTDKDNKNKLTNSTTSDLIAELNKVSDNMDKEIEDLESVISKELNEKGSYDKNSDKNDDSNNSQHKVLQKDTANELALS